MDCRIAHRLISLYIDGELDGEQARQLKAHIESCSECRKKFERMKAVVQMMGALEEEELPDGFMDRLQARLEAEHVIGMVHKKHLGFSGWIKWVGVAAAALVIVLAIRLLGPDRLMYTPSQDKEQAESAAPENMSESSVVDSRNEGLTKSSDAQADASADHQKLYGDDVRASNAESEKTEEAQEAADGYIKSDKVELIVQDVCITPQTILMRVLPHGIDVVDQTQDSITLKVTSVEQRKALYSELKLLGAVKEAGSNVESDTVTIVIVQQE